MKTDTPDQFPRYFAAAFGAQDAAAIAATLIPGAGLLTLSGQWAEGEEAARLALEADFAGPLARARLVTGRIGMIEAGPGVVVLNQRYVVTGAVDGEGAELPRIAAIMVATLASTSEGWRVLSLTLAPLAA